MRCADLRELALARAERLGRLLRVPFAHRELGETFEAVRHHLPKPEPACDVEALLERGPCFLELAEEEVAARDVVHGDREVVEVLQAPLDFDRLVLVAKRRSRVVTEARDGSQVREVRREPELVACLACDRGSLLEAGRRSVEVALADGDVAEQADAACRLVGVAELTKVAESFLE